ncbi:MAG: hypothetical protein IT381_28400 [Deltaproteobacteria bacterium]|nr:hypothetical protein [Deltaproteobacteria bacterium]
MSVSRVGTTDPRAATQSEQINRNEAKGVEKNDAARQVKAAAIAAPKDVLVAGVGGDAEPVAALTTEAVKPMSNAEALALLSALKPLMGKPNGLPFPDEAFAHPALLEGASTQAPLGAETKTILCNALASAATDKAAGDPDALASLLGMQLKTLAFPSRAERQKWLEAQEKKCGALATAIVGDGTSPLPEDVRRRLGPRFAEVSRALEDTFRAQRNAANGPRRMQSDVEIPGPEVVALEKAVAGVLPEITAALRQGSDAAAVVGQLGIDWSLVDIDSLIAIVMMECGRAATDELREALTTMQENNKKKKAQREQLTKMKAEKAEVYAAMHQEYDALRAAGKIDPSYSFEDFAAWRAVEWDAFGNAQLEQPMDPLPDVATHPPPDASAVDGSESTTDAPPPSQIQDVPPCPTEIQQAIADKYGIDPADVGMLWICFYKHGESFPESFDPTQAKFEEFLTSIYQVGLISGESHHNKSMVEGFKEQLAADSAAKKEAAAQAAQPPPLADKTYCTDLEGKSPEQIAAMLDEMFKDPAFAALLSQPPWAALHPGAGGIGHKLLSLVTQMYWEVELGAWENAAAHNQQAHLLGEKLDLLIAKLQEAFPGQTQVLAAMLALPEQYAERRAAELAAWDPPGDGDEFAYNVGVKDTLTNWFTQAVSEGWPSGGAWTGTETFDEFKNGCPLTAPPVPPPPEQPPTWQDEVLDAWPKPTFKPLAATLARGMAPIPKAPAVEATEDTSDTADLGPPPDTLEGARQSGNLAGFEAELQRMDDKIQATSDLSEELSLKLQMLMDRRQKAMELLSNLLKKMSDTSGAIIANTRG